MFLQQEHLQGHEQPQQEHFLPLEFSLVILIYLPSSCVHSKTSSVCFPVGLGSDIMSIYKSMNHLCIMILITNSYIVHCSMLTVQNQGSEKQE